MSWLAVRSPDRAFQAREVLGGRLHKDCKHPAEGAPEAAICVSFKSDRPQRLHAYHSRLPSHLRLSEMRSPHRQSQPKGNDPAGPAHSLDTAGKTCKMVKLLQKAKVPHSAWRGGGARAHTRPRFHCGEAGAHTIQHVDARETHADQSHQSLQSGLINLISRT